MFCTCWIWCHCFEHYICVDKKGHDLVCPPCRGSSLVSWLGVVEMTQATSDLSLPPWCVWLYLGRQNPPVISPKRKFGMEREVDRWWRTKIKSGMMREVERWWRPKRGFGVTQEVEHCVRQERYKLVQKFKPSGWQLQDGDRMVWTHFRPIVVKT